MNNHTTHRYLAMKRYEDAVAKLNLSSLEQEFNGCFSQGINAYVECCGRHPDDALALRWIRADGKQKNYSFGELKQSTAQLANYLVAQGLKPGDRVAGLLPRTPELLITILAVLRSGMVYQPLFTAFGGSAIAHRLKVSGAAMVITDTANFSKLTPWINKAKVLIVNRPDVTFDTECDESLAIGDFWTAIDSSKDSFETIMRRGEEAMLMMFTSGTTGPAKGVVVPNKALLSFITYMRFGLDLQKDDVFWNMADPGWAYGLYYAVVGPLLMGVATTFYEGAFSVDSLCEILRRERITNFASAPTAYRMLKSDGEQVAARLQHDLRVASSAGEPLNKDLAEWFEETFGCRLLDQYGQTELGMVMMSFHGLEHSSPVGASGFPIPGMKLCVVDEEGQLLGVDQPGVLAVDKKHSPLFWFAGYLGMQFEHQLNDLYLTGDSVVKQIDGSFRFVARADDVITSSGYRIGPADVESCLNELPEVLESAAVGKPDDKRGEIVKAYVVLQKDGFSEDICDRLQQYVKTRLGAHAYPREISFISALPKTPSGKIKRFELK